MKSKKRILVAPLDWGIGHATRCIPIIKQLISHNYEVIIAADGRPMHLLSTEFPDLEMIRFSGYNIKYPKYLPMSISMLLQLPKLILGIKKEHSMLNQIIEDYNVNGVISDNRYGLYSNKVPTAFITHQLKIQSPYFSKCIQNIIYKYINKFDACWVMDDDENSLGGELSKADKLPKNTSYIGVQSRFEKVKGRKKYDFLAIVSGPEPQRTILEKRLIKVLKDRKEKSLIVLGKPEIDTYESIGNLSICSHKNATELNIAITQSELIICRPGYSTVMDLAKLEKKAIFIPTPGQTEQEYLATNLQQKGICYSQKQVNFDFEKAINESKKYSGFIALKKTSTNWEKLFSLF